MSKRCFDVCEEKEINCVQKDCRHWIEYPDDLNCSIVCANKNGALTLHETALRLGVSFVRVKQNQDSALIRIQKAIKRSEELADVFIE